MTNICNDLIESINCLTFKMQEDSTPFQDNHHYNSIQDHQANAAMTI